MNTSLRGNSNTGTWHRKKNTREVRKESSQVFSITDAYIRKAEKGRKALVMLRAIHFVLVEEGGLIV